MGDPYRDPATADTEPAPTPTCAICSIASAIIRQKQPDTTEEELVKGALVSAFVDEEFFRGLDRDSFCIPCKLNVAAAKELLAAIARGEVDLGEG